MSADYPNDLKYTKEHEWARLDGNVATIGITKFAVDSLGDITQVDLPPEGEQLRKDAVFGSVDIHGSVAGDVVAVFGSVTLHDSTYIEGDAVAIGGTLNQPPSAMIRGESVSVGFLPVAWSLPTVTVLLFTVALGWVMAVFCG